LSEEKSRILKCFKQTIILLFLLLVLIHLDNSMQKQLSKFFYILDGKRKSLVLMVLLFLFVSGIEVISTGLVGQFISLATDPNSITKSSFFNSIAKWLNFSSQNQLLVVFGSLVVVIFYFKSLLSFFTQKIIFEFGFKMQGELSAKLMHLYLGAPYTFHLDRNSASLIHNITNETSRFSQGVIAPGLTSVSNAVVTLALVGLLIKVNIMAMVVISGILLTSYILMFSLKNKIARWGRQSSEANTEMIRLINHGLGGLKETRVLGCESYFENQMQVQIIKYSTSASLALSFGNLPRYIIEAFLISFLIGFTFLFLMNNQGNSQGLSATLGVFALVSIRLLPAVGNLLTSINGIRYSAYSIDKIYLDLKELDNVNKYSKQKLISFDPNTRPVLPFKTDIILENVTYSYPNSQIKSLDKISLTIKKGESIGLIGKSGAGKTTLVDVMLGLLATQIGDIKIDGTSIYTDLRAWQNMIGYVPQSIFLVDDTLEKNIAFGVPEHLIDSQRLKKAIMAAQLEELIENLPNGLNTMVGERGVLLSGGQRQRIGIARTLYHEREILVFDEATAALDNETEGLVTEAIKSLSGIKTMIIIAHRLSTIEHCDHIYKLDKGRMIDSGSYNEVILSKEMQYESV
jgi:ATP-binding cassette, subfamily B, bacterial PglK